MHQYLLLWVITSLLLFAPLSAAAQDATPAPWPPDPNDIFEAGIEAIEIPPFSPVNTVDNSKRLISIRSQETGHVEQFSFVEAFRDVRSSEIIDGVLWLVVTETSGIRWVWSLDLQTKSFERYIAKCGQQQLISIQSALNLPWVLYEDQPEGKVYLCESTTGNVSAPLPDDMTWLIDDVYLNSPIQPSTSPDEQWVALFAKSNPPLPYQTFVYSYDIVHQQLRRLGDFQSDEIMHFSNWVGTQVMLYTRMMSDSSLESFYIADVTKSQNLEYAFSESGTILDYYDDLPRYEYVHGSVGYNSPFNCSWSVYMVKERKSIIHDLGTMCQPEIGELSETAYYRDIPNMEIGPPSVATLVRYNALTRERKDLYSGEIESVEWVSEDEQFAILTLGNNGIINRAHDIPSEFWDLYSSPLRLAYVDLVAQKVLFEVPALWSAYWDGQELLSTIQPLDQNRFLAIGYTEEQDGLASIFTFDGEKYIKKPLIDHVAYQIGHYLVRWTDGYQQSTRMSLYNIEAGRTIPVIQDVNADNYRINIDEVYSLDHFIITVSNVPSTTTDYQSVRYKVKIPERAG